MSDVGLFALSIWVGRYINLVRRPVLYSAQSSRKGDTKTADSESSRDDTVDAIVASCPSLNRPYYPPLLCCNAHVQCILFTLMSQIWSSRPYVQWKKEKVVLEDGEDTMTLDWANAIPQVASSSSAAIITKPVLVILPVSAQSPT